MKKNSKYTIPAGTLVENRYRVEKIVGEGGMGTVYKATQMAIGRIVALKHLDAKYAENPRLLYRFQREAQAAAAIGHDNICEVTDLGVGPDGSPYFVMPLLKGCTLSDLIRSEQQLSVARIVDIISQVLEALQAAHDAGIVHRDLKPANVFISHIGDREDFVKLLDFGVSKMVTEGASSELTRTGMVMGTSNYMSPEQARGSKTVDHRADLYAVGVTLYEALTQKKPFVGDTYNEIIYKILSDTYTLPRSLDSSIHPAIEEVVIKAMERDRDKRYSSAAEMGVALRKAAAEKREEVLTATAVMSASEESEPPSRPFGNRQYDSVPSRFPGGRSSRTPISNPPRTPISNPPLTPFSSPLFTSTPVRQPGSEPLRKSRDPAVSLPGVTGVMMGRPSKYDHESWVVYRGKEILIRDYSGINTRTARKRAEDSLQSTIEMIENGCKDLLIISDVTDGTADKQTTALLKQIGARLKPYTRKLAVVGVLGIQMVLLNAVSSFSGIEIKSFDKRKDAATWLVED